MPEPKAQVKLLLVGGSLTHACLLKQFAKMSPNILKVALITSAPMICYQEMAGSYLAGDCSDLDITIHLQHRCNIQKADYIEGNVVQIMPGAKEVIMADGRRISYDILALNPDEYGQEVEGVSKYGFPIRFSENMKKLKRQLFTRKIDNRITIIGAGKLGIELAFSIRQVMKRLNFTVAITVIEAAQTILPGYDLKMKKTILDELKTNQIELLLGRRVVRLTGDLLVFNDNSVLDYGFLIWTAHCQQNPLLKESGLALNESGRMIVNRYLQSINMPNVFGSGEHICTDHTAGLFNKIHPQQEAAILAKNILNYCGGKSLKEPVGKIKKKEMIHIGNQRSIFLMNGIVLKGKWGWKWRHDNDIQFTKLLRSE